MRFGSDSNSEGSMQPVAQKSDWDVTDMPRRRKKFVMERCFTPEQIQKLRRGGIPQDMEERWFWYMQGDTLYIHRSWSGICIYMVEFGFDSNRHQVYVNRDKRQYDNRDLNADKRTVEGLLDQWT